jgi:hypothetical protein
MGQERQSQNLNHYTTMRASKRKPGFTTIRVEEAMKLRLCYNQIVAAMALVVCGVSALIVPNLVRAQNLKRSILTPPEQLLGRWFRLV